MQETGQLGHMSSEASNLACLHMSPTWSRYSNTIYSQPIYGLTYQTILNLGNNIDYHVVPCAVCRVRSRGSIMMIPGRNLCPSDWHQEYQGYLMSQQHCVDKDAENVTSSKASWHGVVLYHLYSSCYAGLLPCGPYINGRQLTCSVCTK